MKRVLVLAALAGSLVSQSASALLVSGFEFGFDGSHLQIDETNKLMDVNGIPVESKTLLENSFNGGDVYLGWNYSRYLGFELSYFQSQSAKKTSVVGADTFDATSKVKAFALDVVPRLPVTYDDSFAFIAMFGIGEYRLSTTVTDNAAPATIGGKLGSIHSIGLDMAFGAQYNFTDNVGVRALAKYVKATFDGTAKSMLFTSIGLNFRF